MPRNILPPHTGVFVFVLGAHALALWGLAAGLVMPVQIPTEHVVSAQVIALQADPVPAVAAAQPQTQKSEPKPVVKPVKRKVLSTKQEQAEDVPKVIEAAPAPVTPSSSAQENAAASSTKGDASKSSAQAGVPQERVEPSSNANYLNNPKPEYPPLSQRMGEEGTVRIRVFVLKNGTAQEASVQKSSGYPRLDAAALKAALAWRYVPGTVGGDARDMWVITPVRFKLD